MNDIATNMTEAKDQIARFRSMVATGAFDRLPKRERRRMLLELTDQALGLAAMLEEVGQWFRAGDPEAPVFGTEH